MNYYKTNFAMVQHHHWDLDALESLLPWERHVYIQLLQAYLKDEADARALQAQAQKHHTPRKRTV
jgi:hypothetical protein